MADSFAARFAAVRAVQGPLAFGLDPSAEVLQSWGLSDSADGLDRFADIVLAATHGQVGVVKATVRVLGAAWLARHQDAGTGYRRRA
jgi:orotidine-5'-phosphate decarboxylase